MFGLYLKKDTSDAICVARYGSTLRLGKVTREGASDMLNATRRAYREKANECLHEAALSFSENTSAQWRVLADEWNKLARSRPRRKIAPKLIAGPKMDTAA